MYVLICQNSEEGDGIVAVSKDVLTLKAKAQEIVNREIKDGIHDGNDLLPYLQRGLLWSEPIDDYHESTYVWDDVENYEIVKAEEI